MKIANSDQRILVAVVVDELADKTDLLWGEFQTVALPSARRKLAYWLGRDDVSETDLFNAQEALLDGDDLRYEESVTRIVGF